MLAPQRFFLIYLVLRQLIVYTQKVINMPLLRCQCNIIQTTIIKQIGATDLWSYGFNFFMYRFKNRILEFFGMTQTDTNK